jgi:pimeloyl-ACP methyl ester carboxylesterase
MAVFQHRDKHIHYDLIAGLVPEDTLFLHGNLASNNWWKPTIEELQSRYQEGFSGGAAAFAEWLGCGESSGPATEADLDMFSLARDQIALIKGLGLSDVNLVGHSTGGLIALCALLEEPDLFRRVVLLDPVSAQGVHFDQDMYAAFTRMKEDRAFLETVMAGTVQGCDVNDTLMQQLFNDAQNVDDMIWHGIPNSLKKIDIRKDLKRIKQPVLVLHGENDKLLPAAGSREIASGVAHGEFVEIKGQGHSCNVENPEKFAQLICDFLYES